MRLTFDMKNEAPGQCETDRDEMRPEYDSSRMAGGQRGKYYRAYRKGHTVKVLRADGSTVIQHFRLEDGAVMLEPKIREYFPDSESVNRALRCLIPLLPKRRRGRAAPQQKGTPLGGMSPFARSDELHSGVSLES